MRIEKVFFIFLSFYLLFFFNPHSLQIKRLGILEPDLGRTDKDRKKVNRIYKIVGAVAGAVAGLGVAMSAFADGTYITIPAGFIDDLLGYVGNLFTDLSVLIILVIGLPLGFWVIRRVIGLVRAR